MKKLLFITIIFCLTKNSIAQNVGIGTTYPLMKLHIAKNDSAVALFENTQPLNINVSNALYFKTGNSFFSYTGAIKTVGESTTGARLGLFTSAAYTANGLQERMSITDNGDVGVGNINPLMKFHVTKSGNNVALFENLQLLNTDVSTDLYFKTGNGLLPYTAAIKSIGENASAARLGLFTYSSSTSSALKERMSITDAGNVGIGINTPQTDLHINPAGAGSLLIGSNKNVGGFTNIEMGISAQSNGYSYLQATKASGSTYGALALNASGGNVGVGTTNPIATLDIHGGIAMPIKIVTADYTIQNGDYTIVVDMQNDENKPEVKIYLPAISLNNGRIINVLTINMTSGNNPPSATNKVSIWSANGTILFHTLEKWERSELAPGFHTVNYELGAMFQCLNPAAWVILSRNSTYYRFPT